MNDRDKKIVDVVLEQFIQKGHKFRMEDVAAAMKISKRTIYEEYGNKEKLIDLVVESIFEGIENQLEKIVSNDSYNTLEKLIHMTCAFPDVKDIDYHKAMMLRDDFPQPYEKFIHYIEDNWNLSKKLFDQCIQEGLIRQADHDLYKVVILGVTKQVLDMDIDNQEELMERCVRIVFEGLIIM